MTGMKVCVSPTPLLFTAGWKTDNTVGAIKSHSLRAVHCHLCITALLAYILSFFISSIYLHLTNLFFLGLCFFIFILYL